eukprot:2729820-Rhodomonas_salina.1
MGVFEVVELPKGPLVVILEDEANGACVSRAWHELDHCPSITSRANDTALLSTGPPQSPGRAGRVRSTPKLVTQLWSAYISYSIIRNLNKINQGTKVGEVSWFSKKPRTTPETNLKDDGVCQLPVFPPPRHSAGSPRNRPSSTLSHPPHRLGSIAVIIIESNIIITLRPSWSARSSSSSLLSLPPHLLDSHHQHPIDHHHRSPSLLIGSIVVLIVESTIIIALPPSSSARSSSSSSNRPSSSLFPLPYLLDRRHHHCSFSFLICSIVIIIIESTIIIALPPSSSARSSFSSSN